MTEEKRNDLGNETDVQTAGVTPAEETVMKAPRLSGVGRSRKALRKAQPPKAPVTAEQRP